MPHVSLQTLIEGARSGQYLVSFPTDTVPALASRPDQGERIFEAKQRDRSKPLILMGATIEDLLPYVNGSASELEIWQAVMTRYFPGALTLVLPASDRLPLAMNPTDANTLGIRVPDSAIARYLLAQTGPLATTSANRSGQPALQTLAEIAAEFPDLLIPREEELADLARSLGGSTASSPAGIPSTVAKWTGTGWKILRQGLIQLDPEAFRIDHDR